MLDFAQARRTMVDCQLRTFDITDRAVLAAMGEVPRELFVPPGGQDLAYTDRETPLGTGPEGAARAMMAPMVLGRLIQALKVEAGMAVLEIACGYGYGAALLERLGAKVTALDSMAGMVTAARDRSARHSAGDSAGDPASGSVDLREGPLAEGAADAGPFDRILVNGAVETRPDRLLEQLADGGRLACVVGGRTRAGKATLFVRSGGTIGSTTLFDAHAPLLAEFRDAPAFVF